MMSFVGKFFRFCSSYGVSVVLLFFLLLLTFFGTLEQVNLGLHEVQKKYFESFFLVHHIGSLPVPLPGAYLVMALLFVNLTCGGILRARKDWRRPGMIIAHAGMLLMLVAGAWTYHFSTSGHLTLYEGGKSNEFVSYYTWELSIGEPGTGEELVIPGTDFKHLTDDAEGEFKATGVLPFKLYLSGYEPNAQPLRGSTDPRAADGIGIRGLPLAKEAERNMAAVYARIEREDGSGETGVLWGQARAPWTVDAGGKQWAIDLRKQRWQLPFTIELDKFHRDLHPGTAMAANFSSDVTKTQDGIEETVEIKMNEPLRHRPYTLFQSGWGPPDAGPNDRLYSTFSVVKNEADQWPLYSCIVVTVGLLIHFLQRLVVHVRQQNRRTA